jgi:hypothetical protein
MIPPSRRAGHFDVGFEQEYSVLVQKREKRRQEFERGYKKSDPSRKAQGRSGPE